MSDLGGEASHLRKMLNEATARADEAEAAVLSYAGKLAAAEAEADRLGKLLDNVTEYARSFLFALTDQDPPHQKHFREQLEAWLDKAVQEGTDHAKR